MKYSELRQNLYNWLNDKTSILIIFANQNGPRPNEKFIELRLTSISKLGHKDYTAPDDTTGIRIARIIEDFVLALTSYGSETDDELQKIKEAFNTTEYINELSATGIAVRNDSDIRDISVEIDNEIEERYIYEINMGFSYDFEELAGIIEQVSYISTINQPN